MLGGNIKYGGALGGFVLIFWLVMKAYYNVISQHEKKTPIDIAGAWETVTTEHVQDGRRRGSTIIDQEEKNPLFYVTMELDDIDNPEKKIAIKALIGYIRDREIIWIYETSERNTGIAMASAHEDRPKTLTMRYYDSIFDIGKGRHGSVTWLRKTDRHGKPME
jgi:hypothetical protein